MQPLTTKKEVIPWVQVKAVKCPHYSYDFVSKNKSKKRIFSLWIPTRILGGFVWFILHSHNDFLCNTREQMYLRTITEHHTVLAINFQKQNEHTQALSSTKH